MGHVGSKRERAQGSGPMGRVDRGNDPVILQTKRTSASRSRERKRLDPAQQAAVQTPAEAGLQQP